MYVCMYVCIYEHLYEYVCTKIIKIKINKNLSLKKIDFRRKFTVHTEFRIKKSTEFRGIPRKLTIKIPRNSAELKSLPSKIPSSAEFQKVTSVDTLLSI